MSERVAFMQVGPGGLCFAHGPYKEQNCPQWPACATDGQRDEYIRMGHAQASLASLERAVVEAAIKCWYTDGTDDSESGSYMRGLYGHLHAAVDELVKARKLAAGKPSA